MAKSPDQSESLEEVCPALSFLQETHTKETLLTALQDPSLTYCAQEDLLSSLFRLYRRYQKWTEEAEETLVRLFVLQGNQAPASIAFFETLTDLEILYRKEKVVACRQKVEEELERLVNRAGLSPETALRVEEKWALCKYHWGEKELAKRLLKHVAKKARQSDFLYCVSVQTRLLELCAQHYDQQGELECLWRLFKDKQQRCPYSSASSEALNRFLSFAPYQNLQPFKASCIAQH